MKKLLVTSFFSGISLLMLSQTTSVNIIPIPVSVAAKTGSFQLTDKTVIELASTDADANRVAHFLADALSTPTGYKIAVAKSGSRALAGRGTFLPYYIQTIGVPQFVNNTPYYGSSTSSAEDVRTEFINRGKYKIVPEATGVDALLNGEILAIIDRAGQLHRSGAGQPVHHPGHREDRVPRHAHEQGDLGQPAVAVPRRVRSVGGRRRARPERLLRQDAQRARPRQHRVRQVGRQRDSRSVLIRAQLRPDAFRQQIASKATDPVVLIAGDDEHEKTGARAGGRRHGRGGAPRLQRRAALRDRQVGDADVWSPKRRARCR